MLLFTNHVFINSFTTFEEWTKREEFTFDEGTEFYHDKDHLGIKTVKEDTKTGCYLDGLKGQCGAVVLYSWYINQKSLEQHMKQVEKFLRACGYTKMLATLTSGTNIELLEAQGFKIVDGFNNRRTKNTVNILSKEIVYE